MAKYQGISCSTCPWLRKRVACVTLSRDSTQGFPTPCHSPGCLQDSSRAPGGQETRKHIYSVKSNHLSQLPFCSALQAVSRIEALLLRCKLHRLPDGTVFACPPCLNPQSSLGPPRCPFCLQDFFPRKPSLLPLRAHRARSVQMPLRKPGFTGGKTHVSQH